MRSRPQISTNRAVEIFEEAVSVRRLFCEDNDFFRMTDLWAHLCANDPSWQIKTYRKSGLEPHQRKAGVVALDDRVTLIVDDELWERAENGSLLENFTLAHEAGHLILNHHDKGAVVKNFQLFETPRGRANVPPTVEELEANYVGVFLQCGVQLLSPKWDAISLARRAFSDPYYVKLAMRYVRLEVFQRRLNRPRPPVERVVF